MAVRVAAVVAVLLAALLPALPAGAAGTLSITGLSPDTGPVGTIVVLTGTGFLATDLVAFNETSAVVSHVNTAGTQLRTSVPPLASTGVVTVSDPTTGQIVGLPNDPFNVATGVSASPDHVWAGRRFELSGSDLSPDTSEPIYLRGVLLRQVRTDVHGDFQLGVTVPLDEQSGKMKIWALDPNIGQIGTILFILGAWPQYRHDAQHTGTNPNETSLSPTNVAGLKLLWNKTTDPDATFAMEPSEEYGLAYVGINSPGSTGSASIYALTAVKSSIAWSTGYLYKKFVPEPAIDNGALYLVESDALDEGYLEAMNATTGGFMWRTDIGPGPVPFHSAPVASGSAVYVGSNDGNLYALDTSTGNVLWTFPTGGEVESSPAVSKGIVYVGSDSGQLFAIKASTGKKVWSATFGGPVRSSPSVVGGDVYVGSDDGTVRAFDAASGSPVWSKTFNGKTFATSPAVANGVVYIGGDGASVGNMYALSATTGAKVWTDPSGTGVSDPAVANGVVYYSVANDNLVEAVDAGSGNGLWSTSQITAPTAPIVSNGTVIVPGSNWVWAFYV